MILKKTKQKQLTILTGRMLGLFSASPRLFISSCQVDPTPSSPPHRHESRFARDLRKQSGFRCVADQEKGSPAPGFPSGPTLLCVLGSLRRRHTGQGEREP